MNSVGHSKNYVLPQITGEYLKKDFTPGSKEPSGPGSSQIREARENWNKRNHDVAYQFFQAAIVEGIQKDWLSTAYNCLGQIEILRRNLPEAVNDFLKCLSIPEHDPMDVWQSALRLFFIYDEAGRVAEAHALKELADVSNKRGFALLEKAEKEIRELTRETVSQSDQTNQFAPLQPNPIKSESSSDQKTDSSSELNMLPYVCAAVFVVLAFIVPSSTGFIGGAIGGGIGFIIGLLFKKIILANKKFHLSKTAILIMIVGTVSILGTLLMINILNNSKINRESNLIRGATTEPVVIKTQLSPKDGATLVFVPEGQFLMGSEDSENRHIHPVYLDAFWIDSTEVTNSMYAKCVVAGDCLFPSSLASNTHNDYYDNNEFADYPVIHVTWEQAESYCKWSGGELPTEAQWEKAARGTDGRTYPWGNELPSSKLLNWYRLNKQDTVKVGSFPAGASPYGALDMAGNVQEWVKDWCCSDYSNSSERNPAGPDSGEYRVIRGSSYKNDYSYDYDYFSTYTSLPGEEMFLDDGNTIGFRCVYID